MRSSFTCCIIVIIYPITTGTDFIISIPTHSTLLWYATGMLHSNCIQLWTNSLIIVILWKNTLECTGLPFDFSKPKVTSILFMQSTYIVTVSSSVLPFKKPISTDQEYLTKHHLNPINLTVPKTCESNHFSFKTAIMVWNAAISDLMDERLG